MNDKNRKIGKIAGMALGLCLLAGCGAVAEPANLLDNADWEFRPMTIYYYDGETVQMGHILDAELEKEIVEELNAQPAKEMKIEKLAEEWKKPSYAITFTSKDGERVEISCTEDRWLTNSGSLYKVDYDFGAVWEKLEGVSKDQISVLSYPNAVALVGSHPEFMTKAADFSAYSDAQMKLSAVSMGIAYCEIQNLSQTKKYAYGEYYALQKQVDGEWYDLPSSGTELGFADVYIELEPGMTANVICDLNSYGALEKGATYRLVKNDIAVTWTQE